MFQFTTENVLNDLSRVSVIDDSTSLAGPAVTATPAAGGTFADGTYYYKVTSLNFYGESTPGTQGSGTTATSNNTLNLTWTAVTGATSYNIYRGTSTNAENKLVANVTTNSYADTGTAGTTAVVPTTNTATVIADPGVPAGQKALYVKRLNKFLSANTTAVYKRAGTAAVLEVSTITIPSGATAAGVYRLAIDVRMSGSYPIDYDRWAINKGKPFYVEVKMLAQSTATAFATAFVAGVQTGLQKLNGEVIKDIVVTSSGATVIVTASNEYQRFVYSAVEAYVQDPIDTFIYDFLPYTVTTDQAIGVITTSGAEGFGTSWYLTKNVRIPTQEATRFFGEDQDERPVVGLTYNQYTLKYSATRNIGSLDYVGGHGISYTDHVFWVPTSLASTFETYVTTAFGSTLLIPITT